MGIVPDPIEFMSDFSNNGTGRKISMGYAGLFNVGIMGFAALGGMSVVLISKNSVPEALQAGGLKMLTALFILAATVAAAVYLHKKFQRKSLVILTILIGYFITRYFYSDATQSIEAVNPALTGYLGGLGLPVLFFMDCRWLSGSSSSLAHWQNFPWTAYRLSCHCNPWNFGNHTGCN